MNAGLQALGVQPLVNASTHLRAGEIDLWIAGVDDLSQGTPDLAGSLPDVPLDAPLLLLAHNPDIWLEAGVERADLVLSGHTHGGQVRLPLLGSIHTQGTYLPRRHAAGWFQRGSTRMFVTRGGGRACRCGWASRPGRADRLVPAEPRGRVRGVSSHCVRAGSDVGSRGRNVLIQSPTDPARPAAADDLPNCTAGCGIGDVHSGARGRTASDIVGEAIRFGVVSAA